jgi:hypothetical protein
MPLKSPLRSLVALALAASVAGTPALAAKAPFDLAGPTLEVSLTRGAQTLPIAEAPDLAAGDGLTLKSDLPPGQSARYLLVVAFLRGATNPPPKAWFFGLKTWEHGGHGELKVKVPDGAQEALIFLAPHTLGDFDTLRDAVRSRPGAFVRASQDLNQLGLDRGRLNVYLEAVRATQRDEPARLQAVSTDLARALGIKLDTSCFQKSPDLQAPCLMQDQDSLVLEDGQSASLVRSLSTGATADLMTQLGYAPQMGAGAYSPYVGAVLDIARLLDSLGTAHFQYVPALAALQGDRLQLRLNTAPSFGSVKSVLVAPLPPVGTVQPPPLHAGETAVACLEAPKTVLKVEGAPLVFSTGYARHMSLRLKAKSGQTFEIPAIADVRRGGFEVDTSALNPDDFNGALEGVLHGEWGFAPFEGPAFRFETAQRGLWRLDASEQTALVVGHDVTLRLAGGAGACVKAITLSASGLPAQNLGFKAIGPRETQVTASLVHAAPGPLTLRIQSFGAGEPEVLSAEAFVPASRVDRFVLHAGDKTGELFGAGLASVARLTLGPVAFTPAAPGAAEGEDRLTLVSGDDHSLETLTAGRKLTAKVVLQDGRALSLPVTLLAPRPGIALLAQSLRSPAPAVGALPISLLGPNEIPRGAVVTFSIQARDPTTIAPTDSLEVATTDGAFSTTLSPGAGLTREDAHLAVAKLDTASAFGPSAFGPLRFRLIDPKGDSDWEDLGVLVRLPTLTALKCQRGPPAPCALTGERLYLVQSISAHADFDAAAPIPEGFPGESLDVPHPKDGRLYLKLHDDPSAVGVVALGGKRAKSAPALPAASGRAQGPAS